VVRAADHITQKVINPFKPTTMYILPKYCEGMSRSSKQEISKCFARETSLGLLTSSVVGISNKQGNVASLFNIYFKDDIGSIYSMQIYSIEIFDKYCSTYLEYV
jgi:hypothetical protein